jgi:hypothetical protein
MPEQDQLADPIADADALPALLVAAVGGQAQARRFLQSPAMRASYASSLAEAEVEADDETRETIAQFNRFVRALVASESRAHTNMRQYLGRGRHGRSSVPRLRMPPRPASRAREHRPRQRPRTRTGSAAPRGDPDEPAPARGRPLTELQQALLLVSSGFEVARVDGRVFASFLEILTIKVAAEYARRWDVAA